MPTYRYLCKNCGFELEELQTMSEPPLEMCPKCNTPKLARMMGTGGAFIFKGSGFYLTDYKNSGSTSSASSAAPPKESKSDSESKETKENKESKESKGSKESKESKGSNESKGGNESKESKPSSDSGNKKPPASDSSKPDAKT